MLLLLIIIIVLVLAFGGFFGTRRRRGLSSRGMTDPRHGIGAIAGSRHSHTARLIGWVVSVALWAIASDARPLLALLSLVAAAVIRCLYVILVRAGWGRSVFVSPWFFAIAAACEVVWLLAS